MEILKDGSATAIYGSRAANGVILITTKEVKAKIHSELQYLYGFTSTNSNAKLVEKPKDFITIKMRKEPIEASLWAAGHL
jgi:TonB-dependent SusC/RagA subfamily outer membrane receptor